MKNVRRRRRKGESARWGLVILGSSGGVSELGFAVRGYDVRSLGCNLTESRAPHVTWSPVLCRGA
jgi:hypothetical protein